MRQVQKNKKRASLISLGFSTFFLNRTNRSGIINGGVIGGLEQKGDYKIDCRFNKEDLINRIRNIAKHKKSIHLRNLEAMDLVEEIKRQKCRDNTIIYFDPPYFLKGPGLYMNSYKKSDHIKVANQIRKIKDIHWVVSYDNQEEIRDTYSWVPKNRFVELSFNHSAYKARLGEEVLFLSNTYKNLDLSPLEKFTN
jgi:DNA adenine methylase